jgi:hypothetical protein
LILRGLKWAGHVAGMERRGVYKVLVKKPEEGVYLEDPGVDLRIIFK